MPGCLFYFCAEWQRARRVLLPDPEALQELAETLGPDGELHADTALVQRYSLQGWLLDVQEAAEVGLLPPPEARVGIVVRAAGPEAAPGEEAAAGGDGAPGSPRRQGPGSKGSPASPRLGSLTVGALLSAPASQRAAPHVLPRSNSRGRLQARKISPPGTPAHSPRPGTQGGLRRALTPRTLAAQPRSPERHLTTPNLAPPSSRPTTPRAASPTSGGRATSRAVTMGVPTAARATAAVQITQPLTFLNPAHPLSGLPSPLTRDEFVQEIRRRLRVARLFKTSAIADRGMPDSVLSVEEAEDLFEVLTIVQNPSDGGTSLQTGKQLDIAVEQFFALSRLRRIIEQGSPSLAAFFKSLDLDDNGFIEVAELKHFLKHDGSGAAAALAAGGMDAGSLSSIFLGMLDADGDGHVQLWELRRQMGLAAQPRATLTELLGYFEMKHGVGKGAQGKLTFPATRASLFNFLCQEDLLDLSPEDVVRAVRAWQTGGVEQASPGERERGGKNGGAASAGGNEGGGTLARSSLELALQRLPLEVSWGVEPHAAERLFSALGARVLQLERARRLDACLPPEAVLESSADNSLPELSEMRARFDRLWSRCVGEKGLWRCLGPQSGNDSAAAQLREGCLTRYVDAAQKVVELRGGGGEEPAPGRVDLGPRSLFPNVGDVLAVASTQLQAGRACIIRYRLCGAANYWHPEHQVLKDERDAVPWPVPRKVLGETPFVGIVPRGLRWTSAGGGGFYLGTQSFTHVDPGLRADLPRDAETGLPLLFGHVEITAPYLLRSAQNRGSDGQGAVESYELRLFCSRKGRIIGCIGEPLRVRVEHQALPPPLATLQLLCDGPSVTLRWTALDLGRYAPAAVADAVLLHMRSTHVEQTHSLDPGTLEWEVPDLAPDTDYEFRVRLVNRVGSGREAVATCRTNARCSAPAGLVNAVTSATHAELRWSALEVIGSEVTRDRFQARPEAIERYEAELRVEEGAPEARQAAEPAAGAAGAARAVRASTAAAARGSTAAAARGSTADAAAEAAGEAAAGEAAAGAPPAPPPRTCWWPCGSWTKDMDGSLVTQLSGLQPDTSYALEGFRAVNSMGPGVPAKTLKFWTPPSTPQVVHVRVRQGLVLVALSQTGGSFVREYSLTVSLASRPTNTRSFTLPRSRLRDPPESKKEPELPLDFKQMPLAMDLHEEHSFQLRAKNLGGWSEWSEEFATVAIARQQGADQAQAALIEAIEARDIEQLARVLQEVRDIEFPDERYLVQATELLQTLESAQGRLLEAMEACDPTELEAALRHAEEVQLPGRSEAEALLQKLQEVVRRLETAKGIEDLRSALRAGHEARLPPAILQEAVQRLGTREAAQHGLDLAMEAARVPVLTAALATADGMHLPEEGRARTLLRALERSEALLSAALRSGLLRDLSEALQDARASGLREDGLIGEVTELHGRLLAEQAAAQRRLDAAREARYPEELQAALGAATAAQVPEDELRRAERLLEELERMLAQVGQAVGVERRAATLEAAHEARVPPRLLALAEKQLERLQRLLSARERGDLAGLRRYLKLTAMAEVRPEEVEAARRTYCEWSLLSRRVELAISTAQTEPLRQALQNILSSGVSESDLDWAKTVLATLERRDLGDRRLREGVEAKRCEQLQRVLRVACDVEVRDRELIESAHLVLRSLLQRRLELQSAIRTAELTRVHAALQRAREPPALPEDELASGEKLLKDLQEKELKLLTVMSRLAREARDFRAVDALVLRSRKVAALGVSTESLGVADLERLALEWQAEVQSAIEFDLYCEREEELPAMDSTKSQAGEELEAVVEERGTVNLPMRTVYGEVCLSFAHVGELLVILPRQVVQCTVSVAVADQPGELGVADVPTAEAACEALLQVMAETLDEEDTISRLSGFILEDDGVHKRVDLQISIHLRGDRTAAEVVESLQYCGLSGLAADESVEALCVGLTACPPAELRSLAEGLRKHRAGHGEGTRTDAPLGVGCLQDLRARELRRVTLGVTWTCPGLVQDALDAACVVLSNEHLLEIIDMHGAHGQQYGADVGAVWLDQRNLDGVLGAVQGVGGLTDAQTRTGKQQVLVRLDILPPRASDLVFIITSRNPSELSKYDSLRATITDTDSGEVLATCLLESPDVTAEAVVTVVMSRFDDGLWHVCGVNSKTRGTARNYKLILEKLLELGFPRHTSMKEQVPSILTAMRQKLQLLRPLKCTGVTMDETHTLRVAYVIELIDGDMSVANAEDLVAKIAEPDLQKQVCSVISHSTCDRFTDAHCAIVPATIKPLQQLTAEFSWEFNSQGHDEMKEHAFLDGTCVAFAGQALSEVVDYRGPHGVRLVHNGIFDVNGAWLGRTGIGDATDGAVRHTGEASDTLTRSGSSSFEIQVDQLPPHVTDIFFVFSAPLSRDLGRCANCFARFRDADSRGHELAAMPAPVLGGSEAVVACRLSRTDSGALRLGALGAAMKGTALDYRPLLQRLRAIQRRRMRRESLRTSAYPATSASGRGTMSAQSNGGGQPRQDGRQAP